MNAFSPNGKRWELTPRSSLVSGLAAETGVTPLQAQLLINRGLRDASHIRSFLNPVLSQMCDPREMKGMNDAVETILRAMEDRRIVTVYGDYDADGLTATALLATFLSHSGISVKTYVPDRLKEGYGLNEKAVRRIRENGTGLIITVDCGISNEKEVMLAKRLGMDVVITDHHQLPPGFKACCPVVNPHQPGCPFPFKDLSGAGVSFFLAVGLRAAMRRTGWFRFKKEPDLRDYLDLAALGTVADRVSLLGQNRMLVSAGVERMAHSIWPGIRAIMNVAGVRPENIASEDLSYRIAPRLNAPGRMEDARMGLALLMAERQFEADVMAAKIDAINARRQITEQEILAEATAMIDDRMAGRQTLLLASEKWHSGVLGIVASRLVDRYHRPVMMATIRDGLAVGSGRSIDGFDLYGAMKEMTDCFEKFGGHYHAAGFTLKAGRLEKLGEDLETAAARLLQPDHLVQSIRIDLELPFGGINAKLVSQINALAPYGEGNPEPVFMTGKVAVLDSRVVGARHLKLRLGKGNHIFDAIGFGMGDRHSLRGTTVDILFTPEINRWQGTETVQLKIVDLRH